jgi:2-oxoglutarate dehydrogenase E1 component
MSRQDANAAFALTSFLYGGNASYIDDLYARYERDPKAVDAEWQAFFQSLKDDAVDVEKNARGPSWQRPGWPAPERSELISALDGDWAETSKALDAKVRAQAQTRGVDITSPEVERATRDSIRALMLIRAYRARGHFHANLDPLGLEAPKNEEELDPRTYGFTDADLDRPIFLDKVLGLEFGTVNQIVGILRRTYCQTLGVEFLHISNGAQKGWIQERIEGPDKEISFTREGKRAILNKLVEAEGFEKFCDVKFTGTKRFGLDGAESMIPALEQIIKRGGALGVREIVIGMPHRGRLNVLAQVMGKPQRAIFNEFKGGSSTPNAVEGSGDVKYHLGASSDREFDNNKVHLSLTANPSHLEIVDPVVLGKVRAKQDQLGATPDDRTMVMPLLIHGDASFAGQGVIAESFGLSGLRGHRTGGSVHFIVNNQIGFTTDPRYSRSSPYPSDVAKMIEAPIFHVNGDDPEAVVFAAKISTEFRQKFQKPVVIDMFCYRRHGHNEGDEPSFTQPLMYKAIANHPTTLEIYGKKLIEEGVVSAAEVDKMKADWRNHLDGELEAAQGYRANKADWLDGRWSGFKTAGDAEDPRRGKTGVDIGTLKDIGLKITTLPPGFHLHKTLGRFMENRQKAIETGVGIDWATAEALAFCSLLLEGHRVRLSGQDSERGTFSQRHAVLTDQETENRYTPSPMRSRCGKRSSAISPTARKSFSISLSHRASANGCACPVWSASFRMATKGRGRNTRRRGSSVSCRCAPRTICRWRTAPRRRTISTSCAVSSNAISASR